MISGAYPETHMILLNSQLIDVFIDPLFYMKKNSKYSKYYCLVLAFSNRYWRKFNGFLLCRTLNLYQYVFRPNSTKIPGFVKNTRIRPKYPVSTDIPGSEQKTRTHNSGENFVPRSKLRMRFLARGAYSVRVFQPVSPGSCHTVLPRRKLLLWHTVTITL